MLEDQKVAILGAGKMGETLLSGLLDAGVVNKKRMMVTARRQARADYLREKYDVVATTENSEAVDFADVLVLSVKPQGTEKVLGEIKESIRKDQLLISVVAAVTTKFIESRLGNEVRVIRTMPNTPCLIRQGMTGICAGAYASNDDLGLAQEIFQQVGRTMIVEEKHLDAVTGLSASGPAFIYVVIESMAEGGVKVGLPRDKATELAAQAVLGAASMVLKTNEHPALLKDAVTTPAGCTIDGLMEMEEGGLRVTMIKTIVKATERASQLMKEN